MDLLPTLHPTTVTSLPSFTISGDVSSDEDNDYYNDEREEELLFELSTEMREKEGEKKLEGLSPRPSKRGTLFVTMFHASTHKININTRKLPKLCFHCFWFSQSIA